MRWRGRRQSTNISDQRGAGGGGFGRGGGMRIPIRAGGGGGIGIILIALALWLFFGVNPLSLLGFSDGGYEQTQTTRTAQGPGVQGTPDETDDFVAVVLADTEDVWNARFQAAGSTYPEPTLVLFENRVSSGCGLAGMATGPFYCPADDSLYLDLSFFRQLATQLGAPGDFAQAYVIAHEVGHHVQNVTGVLSRSQEMRQRLPQAEANRVSVATELQADCYAGIFAHDVYDAGFIEPDDVAEAMNAAAQIGDDRLQQAGQGTVVPDSFTHGSSAQRQEWFARGYETGDTDACDTFGELL